MTSLLGAIEDTGDHPLNGGFCPGRHRVPWTVARVHADATVTGTGGRQGAHRWAPMLPLPADFTAWVDQQATETAAAVSVALWPRLVRATRHLPDHTPDHTFVRI